MDQHETARFGSFGSFGKWNDNLLIPEGSFNFLSEIGSRPQSICHDNSFDLSRQLKVLNLEIVDIDDSRNNSLEETSLQEKLRQKIRRLSKKIQELSKELKKTKQDHISMIGKFNWEKIIKDIVFQSLSGKNKISSPVSTESNQCPYCCKNVSEIKTENFRDDELKALKAERDRQNQQIKEFQENIKAMESLFIKKELQRKKQLETKQHQWKAKIDKIIHQLEQENYFRFSNATKDKSILNQSYKQAIKTQSSSIHPSEIQSATVRRRKDNSFTNPESSYKCLRTRIKTIQNLLREDLQTFS